MRRLLLSAALGAVFALAAYPQDYLDAVLYLTGASAEEELGEEVLERFEALASRPLRLNTAPEARLVSSGLLSRYQAASVADYRRNYGDILSVQELALLDGFGEETALALAPFVSFESQAPPGRSSLEKGRVKTEALMRASLLASEGEGSIGSAMKLRTGNEERWLVSVAAKQAPGGALWPPAGLSASAAVYGRRLPLTAVLGDFNARFGQGLLQWSGFSLSGVQSAAAMDRHPSGLSPAWTLSPDAVHRGVAADLSLGRLVLSAFWSAGKCAGANLTWLARYGQLGVTAIDAGRASIDWRWSRGKWDLFGELAGDAVGRCGAFIAGGAWNPAYQVRLAASVRVYPAAFVGSFAGALRSSTRSSDERGAAIALDYRKFCITSDAAFHPGKGTAQYKTVVKYTPQLSERLTAGFRAVSRYRPADTYPWRNELRAEAALAGPAGISLKGCAAVCRSAGTSWLTYLEGGYLKENADGRVSFYLRGTAFKVDRWEDRIYIYERDVPGSFSVSAFYGRGCSASAVASVKRRHLALHARAGLTAYPGMGGKKPGKAGLKFQCQFIF